MAEAAAATAAATAEAVGELRSVRRKHRTGGRNDEGNRGNGHSFGAGITSPTATAPRH